MLAYFPLHESTIVYLLLHSWVFLNCQYYTIVNNILMIFFFLHKCSTHIFIGGLVFGASPKLGPRAASLPGWCWGSRERERMRVSGHCPGSLERSLGTGCPQERTQCFFLMASDHTAACKGGRREGLAF